MRIMQGDCLRIMPALPDASIDLILADLPYGTTACKWDAVIPFAPLWAEYKRIIKPNGAIVLFASQPFTSALVTSNPAWFKYELVWDKQHGKAPGVAKFRPMPSHENIIVFGKGKTVYNPQWREGEPYTHKVNVKRNQPHGEELYGGFSKGKPYVSQSDGRRYPLSVLPFKTVPKKGESLHPTQKPVALLEYLIRTYTEPGAVVMDNVMGSGSTGVAAFNTGRKFLGIEQDAGYFEIARKRLADAGAPVTVVYEIPEPLAEAWANA